MDRFDNKYNPNLCKILLAISDLLFFNVALWASLGVVYLIFDEVQRFVPQEQLDNRFISHFILSIVCVGWFWVRLRHYTYRKPFWGDAANLLI